jgi:hypothetical protein
MNAEWHAAEGEPRRKGPSSSISGGASSSGTAIATLSSDDAQVQEAATRDPHASFPWTLEATS